MSHLAQLRFIYPEAISLSYAANRRSSLGGKAEPILLIDMAGPKSSALAGAPSLPATSAIHLGSPANIDSAQQPCQRADSRGEANPHLAVQGLGQSPKVSNKAQAAIDRQGTRPMQGKMGTPTHSQPTPGRNASLAAAAAAASTPGRALRQGFSQRLRSWLAQHQPTAAAAMAASHLDPSAPTDTAAAACMASGASQPISCVKPTVSSMNGPRTLGTDSMLGSKAFIPHHATDPTQSDHMESSRGSVCKRHDTQQSTVGMLVNAESLPDVPEMDFPPVPTPRSMPMQTPFAMTPMSAARGSGPEDPASLSAARASAGLANARRLSFGGGMAQTFRLTIHVGLSVENPIAQAWCICWISGKKYSCASLMHRAFWAGRI